MPAHIALDLGTVTGWAIDDGRSITSGTINLKPRRFEGGGMRFLRFRHWLDEVRTAGPGPIARGGAAGGAAEYTSGAVVGEAAPDRGGRR